ncbi:MAG: ATP-dependent sacrificial sulfur transferase LarE, partial [Syntrophobacteria bacterium]
MDEPLGKLRSILSDLDSVLIAFSGGLDSTFLLHIAHEVLGERAQALTFVSPFLSQRERICATTFCEKKRIKQILLQVNPLELPQIRRNPPDRCYHCKRYLFSRGVAKAGELGVPHLVEGSQLSEAAEHRPGREALRELNIRSPLLEAGLDKEHIRRLSRHLGLESWNLPPMACLASRIPYGIGLDPQKLARVEAAEQFLFNEGFRVVRVREIQDSARVELALDELGRLVEEDLRQR